MPYLCTVPRIQACGTVVRMSGMSVFCRCTRDTRRAIVLVADRDNII
jgi:hypothetical protein